MSRVDLGKIVAGATAGDSFSNQPLLAYATTTGSNKTLDIWIPLNMINVSSFTCTKLTLRFRSCKGGYVPSNNFDALSDENITLGALTVRRNGIIIRLTNANVWANIDNNMVCAGDVTFSGVFS